LGYGSGIVVVKVPEWGELILAEKTQTFDRPDVFNLSKDWGFDPDSALLTLLLMLFTCMNTSIALMIHLLSRCPFSEKGG